MASLAAERFLADRNAPVCSLNVAKSFGQLRSVTSDQLAEVRTTHA